MWYIFSQINSRRKKQAYNFEVLPSAMFVLQLVFVSILGLIATWVLAGYNGLSWTVVIMLIVVAIYQFMTTQTVLGGIFTRLAAIQKRRSGVALTLRR